MDQCHIFKVSSLIETVSWFSMKVYTVDEELAIKGISCTYIPSTEKKNASAILSRSATRCGV